MIKFFRKIRQNLLNEGKTGKYFKYAIGEIVLVVIGILIALSINDWNDSRKEAKEEIYLLHQLQQEFVNDSIELRRLVRLTKIKTDKNKVLRDMIENDKIRVDSLVIIAFFAGRLLQFDSYSPTFDEIISSGKSNVLKGKNVMPLIKRYKKELEGINNYLYKENQRRKEDYNSHLYVYFDPELDTYLRSSLPNIKVNEINNFQFNIDGFKTDPKTFYHIKVVGGVDAHLNYIFNNQLLPQIENILKELRVELAR